MLIDNKADVNAKTNYSNTPLFSAVSQSEIIKLLLNNKALVDQRPIRQAFEEIEDPASDTSAKAKESLKLLIKAKINQSC